MECALANFAMVQERDIDTHRKRERRERKRATVQGREKEKESMGQRRTASISFQEQRPGNQKLSLIHLFLKRKIVGTLSFHSSLVILRSLVISQQRVAKR